MDIKYASSVCLLVEVFIDILTQDVIIAALYVSTKMHDTLKKPRDILMVSYTVRFPELAARSKAMGGEVEIDPAVRSLLLENVEVGH